MHPGIESPGRPTFAELHGAGAEVSVEDLRIERLFDADALGAAPSARREGKPDVVVLTGADGFLGRFVLLYLLERVRTDGGRVVALVDARTDAAARDRLLQAYLGVDPTLTMRFQRLAAGRLDVIASEVALARLGLPEERWSRLAGDVTAVVHAAAVADRTRSYEALYEPNVLGAMEAVRLALPCRAAVCLVSTIGVAAGLARKAPVREDERASSLARLRPTDRAGFATSMWAAEVLLEQVHARTRIATSIFRASTLLPPRSFLGQVDPSDPLTQLLRGIVSTRLAPRTFYPGATSKPHFDGVAVDSVAQVIAGTVLAKRPGYSAYHAVDGRFADGISLDAIVDWTEKVGYPMERMADLGAWRAAFHARLASLGLEEPPLDAWCPDVPVENTAFREQLAAVVPGELPAVPAIDELSVQQHLKNMVYRGLIEHPPLIVAA